MLGYRGKVSIAMTGSATESSGGRRVFDVMRANQSMDELGDSRFHESLMREIRRQLDRTKPFEPEGG